eukprot:2931597-Prymnesium_polylepis.1
MRHAPPAARARARRRSLAVVEDVLSREAERRVYLPKGDSSALDSLPETLDAARAAHAALLAAHAHGVRPSADPAVVLYEGALSGAWCDAIIAAFEGGGAAEQYVGNVGTADGFVVK